MESTDVHLKSKSNALVYSVAMKPLVKMVMGTTGVYTVLFHASSRVTQIPLKLL